MSSKSVAVTKSGSIERNMFSPVINTSYKVRDTHWFRLQTLLSALG